MSIFIGRYNAENMVKPEDIDEEIAKILIIMARNAIEYYLDHEETPSEPPDIIEKYPVLKKNSAVFITLEKISGGVRELRGCIGFVLPHMPLWRAVIESAISSAFKDPRFDPVEKSELEEIVVEISILGMPERVRKPLEEVTIGRDGLYMVKKLFSGILLPQVPVDYCWDVETFLAETCIKAGLEPSCWLDEDTEIYRIPGRIYIEETPRGRIIMRDLVKEYMDKCGAINV
ncbi:MAG: TIGR00296 family protein [Sulfolobales archaeon]